MVYSSPAFLSEQIRKHLNGKDLIEYKIKRIILPTHTHPDDPWSYKIEFYILNYKIYDFMLWIDRSNNIQDLSVFIDKNGKFMNFVNSPTDKENRWVSLTDNVYLIHRYNLLNNSEYGINIADEFGIEQNDQLKLYFPKHTFKQLLLDIHQLHCEAKLRINPK